MDKDNIDPNKLKSIAPPETVFERVPITDEDKLYAGAAPMHIFTGKITIPPEGGMNLWFKGQPFPKKGFHFPGAAIPVNIVKKNTMMIVIAAAQKNLLLAGIGFALTPMRRKIAVLETFLVHYNRNANYLLDRVYLKPNFMTPCSQQIWKFLKTFLTELGVSAEVADNTGKVFAHLIEHDDAYRYRIEDIFSETTVAALRIAPANEINRLLSVYSIRQHNDKEMVDKFGSFGTLLSFAIMSRRVKEAFDAAVLAVDFKYLQLDAADHYHCLTRPDYDFFGKTIDERLVEYEAIHKGEYPPVIEYK